MKYNHVGFTPEWINSVSEEVFIQESKHLGLSEDQLKEAYALNKTQNEAKEKKLREEAIQKKKQADETAAAQAKLLSRQAESHATTEPEKPVNNGVNSRIQKPSVKSEGGGDSGTGAGGKS